VGIYLTQVATTSCVRSGRVGPPVVPGGPDLSEVDSPVDLMASKPERPRSPGGAWRSPTDWPCGARCTSSVTFIWASIRNLRTGSVAAREKVQAVAPRGQKYQYAD